MQTCQWPWQIQQSASSLNVVVVVGAIFKTRELCLNTHNFVTISYILDSFKGHRPTHSVYFGVTTNQLLNLILSCKQLITCTVIPMTSSKSETTSDQSGLEQSNLVLRRTGHAPTILWERLAPFHIALWIQIIPSHAQANPDTIGIRSRLNSDYRILLISGFHNEIAQSHSQAPERARKMAEKGRKWSDAETKLLLDIWSQENI